ncbi:MAG TPA: hypothetical protein VFV19_07080 [Candidatus Polarisedimenticolaceae bacterium]|nr:hypothetical protein [Candidatus Polarisedimenticolaceae bacterium]
MRDLLREHDPATGRELSSFDRAAMRARLVAAAERPAAGRPLPRWALAAATVVAVVFFVWTEVRLPETPTAASPPAPTRILLTAPAGTRILWFVGTPDAKELRS